MMPRVQVRLLTVCAAATLAGCAQPQSEPNAAPTADNRYVGTAVCAQCHEAQASAWSRSHHANAMAVADDGSVRGNFDDTRFEYGNYFVEFSVRDGQYRITTNDLPYERNSTVDEPTAGSASASASAPPATFDVRYTFGFDPLQQYLVEVEPGRLQALNVAWSAEPASTGWFDLYAGQPLSRDDPLHWSSELHNWNSRCASCHVTAFAKNYAAATDEYASAWAADNVACEACHGPGSEHAASPVVPLPVSTAIDSQWLLSAAPIAVRTAPGSDDRAAAQVDACAACHSRRAQLAPHEAGGAYLDAFEPAWLSDGLYQADGQILDEVFVYGSFLQSAMYAAGVACTDCHDAHSGELRADGDALCAGCHRADVFAIEEHHRHSAQSRPQCVDCHMPATTYMTVDPRRDHSFRVPRPDLSDAIDARNACNACHRDADAAWAQSFVAQWFPEGRWRTGHYGEALHAGRSWSADRRSSLLEVVYDEAQPAIVRGTALRSLLRQLDTSAIDALDYAARSSSELLQLAALQSLDDADDATRIRIAQRFLDHRFLALRIAAARALMPVRSQLSASRRSDLEAAMAEYAATLAYNEDTSEGSLGLGLLAERNGDTAGARDAYESAIAKNSGFAAAWINLADLLRRSGSESQANATLNSGLQTAAAQDPALHAALGLSYVRLGDTSAALDSLERAVDLSGGDPFNAYAYGLALASVESAQSAIEYLDAASTRSPGYAPLLFALATLSRDTGDLDAARDYTSRLLAASPGDPQGVALERELESLR